MDAKTMGAVASLEAFCAESPTILACEMSMADTPATVRVAGLDLEPVRLFTPAQVAAAQVEVRALLARFRGQVAA